MPNTSVRAAAEGMPSINRRDQDLKEQFIWLINRLPPEQLKETLRELEALAQAERTPKQEMQS